MGKVIVSFSEGDENCHFLDTLPKQIQDLAKRVLWQPEAVKSSLGRWGHVYDYAMRRTNLPLYLTKRVLLNYKKDE
jgi:hypothetical protein